MSAYIIMLRERTRDPNSLAAYRELFPATMQGHSMSFIARHGRFEVLEGPAAEDVVIAEFPSIAAAKQWYDSDAYIQARQLRYLGGDYRCILVDGVR